MKTQRKKVNTKKAPKSKVKAKKPAQKKPVVLPIAAKEEWYRVDTEVRVTDTLGAVGYIYTVGQEVSSEEQARNTMEGMKLIGVGGRLLHLDGTPAGKILATWGNVEQMAEAERLEKAALEPKS